MKKSILNYSIIITIVTVLSMLFTKDIYGELLNPIVTDFIIGMVGSSIGLLSCYISSKRAKTYGSKKKAFADVMVDIVSIFLHVIFLISWWTLAKGFLPKGIMTGVEFGFIVSFVVLMSVIAVWEFIITLKNCYKILTSTEWIE